MSPQTVLLRTTFTRTITIYRIMIWLLGSNHLQFYVPLDGRAPERLANDYISYASNVRRIRQQLSFNHLCKDLSLVPAGLRLKSPLNTQEATQIVKATCRRLVRARINDCHRRLTCNYYKDKLQQRLDKLWQLMPTDLLYTILTIAERQANKTAEQHRTKTQLKLTWLQRTKDKKRQKPEDN